MYTPMSRLNRLLILLFLPLSGKVEDTRIS